MNIALIAHDRKKELMVQFCMAYCGILAKHNLCATGTTGVFEKNVENGPRRRRRTKRRAALPSVRRRIGENNANGRKRRNARARRAGATLSGRVFRPY